MDNPKIRIESDGNFVELYLNGEKVKSQLIDFRFHANVKNQKISIEWGGLIAVEDESGSPVIKHDNIMTENFYYDSNDKEGEKAVNDKICGHQL